MRFRAFMLAFLAAALAGCSGFNLKRLAPPGIIRYERIADEKEPNPVIASEIREYRTQSRPRFPKIGETAAAGEQAEKPATPEDVIDALEEERASLESTLDDDRAGAAADREDAIRMDEASANLASDIDRQKSIEAREKARVDKN